ncbi:hypothetical protein [Oceanobacillus massiliensis]|uniref:hypothetical protein n=1 Tax=Oceanobacillus massiliensis TaxID=1465765 RepID=UPI003017E6E2
MNEFGSFVGCKVRILRDSTGYTSDLIGKVFTIVDEEFDTGDENIMNFTIVTGRPTNDPNLKNNEEIVSSLDVEIV